MAASVEVTAFTHRGRVREANQDSITVAGWVADVEMTGLRRSRHVLDEPLLCAIADGMGGHAAGEVASRYTIKQLAAEHFPGDGAAAVAAALDGVNRELYQTMAVMPEYRGMGTTVVGLLLSERQAVWFNVGDSRLYRWRDGDLEQVSVDDTPPHARSGMLTRSLGGGADVWRDRAACRNAGACGAVALALVQRRPHRHADRCRDRRGVCARRRGGRR
jgi:serine/threonine protein phosphatase PrpC